MSDDGDEDGGKGEVVERDAEGCALLGRDVGVEDVREDGEKTLGREGVEIGDEGSEVLLRGDALEEGG